MNGLNASRGFELAIGVLLVIVGSLLLFDKLNVSVRLAEYWPVALIALGVAKLLEDDEAQSQPAGGMNGEIEKCNQKTPA
jgi:uncharacterized membrane protein HdeD (DUF308 family)